MSVKLKFIFLIVSILFLVVVAMDVLLGQKMGTSTQINDLDDPPADIKKRLRMEDSHLKAPRKRVFLDESLAAARYQAALDSDLRSRQENIQKREERQRIKDFLETPAGEYLSKGMELLAAGNRDEAQVYIRQGLDLHQQFEFEMYTVFLKTLIHSYVQKDDLKDIDQAVLKYLNLIKSTYDNQDFLKTVDLLIDRIEEKMSAGSE